jgi:hypothetical protein
LSAAPTTRRGRNPQQSSGSANCHVDVTVLNGSPLVKTMIV